MMMGIISFVLGRQWLALPIVAMLAFGSAWFIKGIAEELECANEARVAALKVELANQKTITANNERLRQAADKDVESLKIEIVKRDQRAAALIEQFKDAGKDCQFTDEELKRLEGTP